MLCCPNFSCFGLGLVYSSNFRLECLHTFLQFCDGGLGSINSGLVLTHGIFFLLLGFLTLRQLLIAECLVSSVLLSFCQKLGNHIFDKTPDLDEWICCSCRCNLHQLEAVMCTT